MPLSLYVYIAIPKKKAKATSECYWTTCDQRNKSIYKLCLRLIVLLWSHGQIFSFEITNIKSLNILNTQEAHLTSARFSLLHYARPITVWHASEIECCRGQWTAVPCHPPYNYSILHIIYEPHKYNKKISTYANNLPLLKQLLINEQNLLSFQYDEIGSNYWNG